MIQREEKAIYRLRVNLLENKMTLSEVEKMTRTMKPQRQLSTLPLEFYAEQKKSC